LFDRDAIPPSRPETKRSAARRRRHRMAFFRSPPQGGSSLTVPSTALRWLGRERRAIGEHPIHDDGEFAGQRHRGFLHPCPLDDPHPAEVTALKKTPVFVGCSSPS
jgi:hypothetical protein